MDFINIEFKAHCGSPEKVREELRERGAEYAGKDHQVDTYFNVPHGRLKIREGSIENALIFYSRPDVAEMKQSDVMIQPVDPDSGLKDLLAASLGVLAVVDKQREIYYIDNVKFHLDHVDGLGCFVEVEAIQRRRDMTADFLRSQTQKYFDAFGLEKDDLVDVSYSDLVFRTAAAQRG
jgi:predicted adenylyl cyclase CyaB